MQCGFEERPRLSKFLQLRDIDLEHLPRSLRWQSLTGYHMDHTPSTEKQTTISLDASRSFLFSFYTLRGLDIVVAIFTLY